MAQSNLDPQKTQARPYKRKTVYIKKKFQRDFILKFCLTAVLAMIIASILAYLLTSDTLTATYRYHRLTLESTGDAIIWAIVAANAAVLLALLATTIYVTLYVSHKIAGPLYRFEQDLRELAQGNLAQQFRVRANDQLKDLVGQLNQVATGLNDRVAQLRERADRLALAASQESPDLPALRGEAAELRQEIDRLFVLR